jgi:hypothetical protein
MPSGMSSWPLERPTTYCKTTAIMSSTSDEATRRSELITYFGDSLKDNQDIMQECTVLAFTLRHACDLR